jgi:hypothetical protein
MFDGYRHCRAEQFISAAGNARTSGTSSISTVISLLPGETSTSNSTPSSDSGSRTLVRTSRPPALVARRRKPTGVHFDSAV